MSQATLQNTVVSLPQLSSLADVPVHGVAVGSYERRSKPKKKHSMNGDNIALGIIGGLAGGAALGAGIYHAATLKLRREGVFIPEFVKAALQSRVAALVTQNSGPKHEADHGRLLQLVRQNSPAQLARLLELQLEEYVNELEDWAAAPNRGKKKSSASFQDERERFPQLKVNVLVAQAGQLTERQHALFQNIARCLNIPNYDPVRHFTDAFPDDAAQRNALKILGQVGPTRLEIGPNSKAFMDRFYTHLIKPQLSNRNQALYERALRKINVRSSDFRQPVQVTTSAR